MTLTILTLITVLSLTVEPWLDALQAILITKAQSPWVTEAYFGPRRIINTASLFCLECAAILFENIELY